MVMLVSPPAPAWFPIGITYLLGYPQPVRSGGADLVTAWDVVRDAFAEHDVPSTLMGVTVLGYDNQLVEIEATAAILD